MGTLAGNLMIKHRNKEFPSDIYITFKALDVKVNVLFDKATTKNLSLDEFYATDMTGKLILSFELSKYDKESYKFESYKVSCTLKLSKVSITIFSYRLCQELKMLMLMSMLLSYSKFPR